MNRLTRFIRNAFVPYGVNPGWNLTAVITLGGVALLGVSALLSQLGYGTVDPVVIEIGKAAFYTGIGRATMPHTINEEETIEHD